MNDTPQFIEGYAAGDRVRLVQNHLLTGQVIGERSWGMEYLVRLGATVSSIWFDVVELEPDPDFEPDNAASAKPETTENDNVVDFKTAAVGLRKGA